MGCCWGEEKLVRGRAIVDVFPTSRRFWLPEQPRAIKLSFATAVQKKKKIFFLEDTEQKEFHAIPVQSLI